MLQETPTEDRGPWGSPTLRSHILSPLRPYASESSWTSSRESQCSLSGAGMRLMCWVSWSFAQVQEAGAAPCCRAVCCGPGTETGRAGAAVSDPGTVTGEQAQGEGGCPTEIGGAQPFPEPEPGSPCLRSGGEEGSHPSQISFLHVTPEVRTSFLSPMSHLHTV